MKITLLVLVLCVFYSATNAHIEVLERGAEKVAGGVKHVVNTVTDGVRDGFKLKVGVLKKLFGGGKTQDDRSVSCDHPDHYGQHVHHHHHHHYDEPQGNPNNTPLAPIPTNPPLAPFPDVQRPHGTPAPFNPFKGPEKEAQREPDANYPDIDVRSLGV